MTSGLVTYLSLQALHRIHIFVTTITLRIGTRRQLSEAFGHAGPTTKNGLLNRNIH